LWVTCDRLVVFSVKSAFLPIQWYNWNMVKSGIKHHNHNPSVVYIYCIYCIGFFCFFLFFQEFWERLKYKRLHKKIFRWTIIIDYYMAFFISHVISNRDAHISPMAGVPRANMGRGLIWHVIWKMPYHNLFIIYFNVSFFIFVRADRFQKQCSLIWDMMQ